MSARDQQTGAYFFCSAYKDLGSAAASRLYSLRTHQRTVADLEKVVMSVLLTGRWVTW